MENRAYREKTDEELMDICGADGEAFGELARRYQPMAFRAALAVLHSRAEAEDQVQAAFCKALQHLGTFERRAKFSTWLVRIVVNECLMQVRRSRRIRVTKLDEPAHQDFSIAPWSPEQALNRLRLAQVVQREIRYIPPLLRNVFVLRDVKRKSMPDVAAELGISVAAAKSRLCRAREELRRRLEPHVLEHVTTRPLCRAPSQTDSIHRRYQDDSRISKGTPTPGARRAS